jgi:DNA-binding transcriptional MerR regulator
MNAFTIKDLETLSGIKAHTIRIWEQRYSLLKPQRTTTNIRYYTNEELKTVLNISLLNKYGYKISHIDKMSVAEVQEKILLLSQSEALQERVINDLIHFMVDVNLEAFETVLDQQIALKGVEKTIKSTVFPFLERIGMLWVSNHINPAQEHFVTNIIRQKLILGIENTPAQLHRPNTALLFLPEGEYHELGILFMHYLLKSNGVKVCYLGANVPIKDVEFAVKVTNPTFVYTHLTSVAHNFNLEKFLLNIQHRLHDQKVVISGLLTQIYKKRLPDNVCFKKSLAEVMDYISSLQK